MTYSLSILRTAQRQLAKIDQQYQERIIAAIQGLAGDPRPHGTKKLSGRPAWRIRVGDFRVIYEIHDEQLLVLVITIGHRKEIYR